MRSHHPSLLGCWSMRCASINRILAMTAHVHTASGILTKGSPETPSKSNLLWNMDTAEALNQSYGMHSLEIWIECGEPLNLWELKVWHCLFEWKTLWCSISVYLKKMVPFAEKKKSWHSSFCFNLTTIHCHNKTLQTPLNTFAGFIFYSGCIYLVISFRWCYFLS